MMYYIDVGFVIAAAGMGYWAFVSSTPRKAMIRCMIGSVFLIIAILTVN